MAERGLAPRSGENARRATCSGTVVVVVDDQVATRDGGPALCTRIQILLEDSDADMAVIDVAGLTNPDVGTVDALARALLTARRLGRDVRLRHASRQLQDLFTLVGLDDVLS